MSGVNSRGAGRKKALSETQRKNARERFLQGESVSSLAKEYNVSRQTMSGYLHSTDDDKLQNIYSVYKQWARLNREFHGTDLNDYTMRLEYMNKDRVCTVILVDFFHQKILIHNESDFLLERAFGMNSRPTWQDFNLFLEERCFPRSRFGIKMILSDLGLDSYDPIAIIEKTNGRMAEDNQWIRISRYRKEMEQWKK
ncbi:MAG: helix-turn-helix domain-containing protein [Alistipes sp.]|nr:helix-turn-helix domain-containing protein [Alistipes sp.]